MAIAYFSEKVAQANRRLKVLGAQDLGISRNHYECLLTEEIKRRRSSEAKTFLQPVLALQNQSHNERIVWHFRCVSEETVNWSTKFVLITTDFGTDEMKIAHTIFNLKIRKTIGQSIITSSLHYSVYQPEHVEYYLYLRLFPP